jgi:hypothetical protein
VAWQATGISGLRPSHPQRQLACCRLRTGFHDPCPSGLREEGLTAKPIFDKTSLLAAVTWAAGRHSVTQLIQSAFAQGKNMINFELSSLTAVSARLSESAFKFNLIF